MKDLSGQTGRATERISEQVSTIQLATDKTVKAIGHIGRTIEDINKISADIKRSVHEQMAATQEISRSALNASESAVLVSGNIEKVSHAAVNTRTASSQVLGAAKDLNQQSTFLHAEVETFLTTVRSN